MFSSVEPIKKSRPSTSYVEVAGGRGGEAGAHLFRGGVVLKGIIHERDLTRHHAERKHGACDTNNIDYYGNVKNLKIRSRSPKHNAPFKYPLEKSNATLGDGIGFHLESLSWCRGSVPADGCYT